MTGCKHFAVKFLHWLRLRLIKPGFCISMGMRSSSVMCVHRLRFSTVSLVQVPVNTCKTHSIQRLCNILHTHKLISMLLTPKVCDEKLLFISFKAFNFEKNMFIICRQVLETHRKLKHSRMVRYGSTLATRMSSQYKSTSCVVLFMFILISVHFPENQIRIFSAVC